MFNLLPEQIKQQIRNYLAIGDFISAKQIYDQWRQANACPAVN